MSIHNKGQPQKMLIKIISEDQTLCSESEPLLRSVQTTELKGIYGYSGTKWSNIITAQCTYKSVAVFDIITVEVSGFYFTDGSVVVGAIVENTELYSRF